ncbi:MAG TPA: hypothetical protein VK892_16795 [Pyrinomonadaceae bacterium]|nr:hypothetical protein [Pyrinomonadaceae bacterium]
MTKLNFDLLDDESALQTIETVAKLADENDIDWALAGGLAVILYGSDRLTKDVDIIASKKLPLESEGKLVQGGERYAVKTSKKTVSVDWITRTDEAKKFYEQALKDAVMIADTPILTPEWLVILKFIAGRFKDQEDAVFLLRQKGLVDRNKVKQMILEIGGNVTWAAFRSGLERWYELADGGKPPLKEGYIDS